MSAPRVNHPPAARLAGQRSLFEAAAAELIREAANATERAGTLHGCTKTAAEQRARKLYSRAAAWLDYERECNDVQRIAWAELGRLRGEHFRPVGTPLTVEAPPCSCS